MERGDQPRLAVDGERRLDERGDIEAADFTLGPALDCALDQIDDVHAFAEDQRFAVGCKVARR